MTAAADRVGWTKAEYDAAPRAIGRLHDRVLELEDACAILEDAVRETVSRSRLSRRTRQRLKAALAAVEGALL